MHKRQDYASNKTHAWELEQAFNSFNQASDYLTETYQQLESQVQTLSNELVQAHKQKNIQHEEKEQLARRMHELIQALPAGIVVLDSDGIVVEHNPCAKMLLGEPLRQQKWLDIVKRCFQPRWDDGHDISLVDGRCVNLSTQSLGGSGQLLLLNEVTETKRLQQQLDRLKRTSAMGEVASALAHQVRTPLSSAMLYAANLYRNDLNEKLAKRFVDKLLSRLRHLERLVEDMLLFARGGGMDTRVILLKDFMREFQDSIAPLLSQHNASITITNQCESLSININKHTMLSVFQSLVENAIQNREDDLEIKINIDQIGQDQIEILFCDNGPGINADIQSHIFEPFYTTRQGGTGLGLAVADAVLRSHKGQIKLQASNVGAVFNIQLPLAINKNTNSNSNKMRHGYA